MTFNDRHQDRHAGIEKYRDSAEQMDVACRFGWAQAYTGLDRGDGNICEEDDVECSRQDWRWSDGSPYNYPQLSEWQEDEPGVTEKCMRLREGKWWGRHCHFEFYCLCERFMSKGKCALY